MMDKFGHAASSLHGGVFSGLLALVSLVVVLGLYAPQNAFSQELNQEPIANADFYVTDENTTLNEGAPGVLGNDSDPDGDFLSASLVVGPAHGSLTFNADGSFSYTPAFGYFGPDNFEYIALDGNGGGATAIVSITVNPVNDPPVDDDESATISEDNFIFFNVLNNAFDPDGDPLTAILVSGPSHGSLDLDPNGDAQYTPDPNFHGDDSFDYEVSDGNGGTDSSTVFITVLPVNDAPVANDDSYDINTGETVSANIFDNDSDPDGDAFTASITQAPSNGIVVLTIATGEFTYTPSAGFSGEDNFKYILNDGTDNSNEATVTIKVLSPIEQTQNLIDDVDNADLSKTVEKALMGPLKKIAKILEDDNPDNDGSVCGKLDEFIDTVDAKETAGQLDSTDADAFRDAAEDIQQALGC